MNRVFLVLLAVSHVACCQSRPQQSTTRPEAYYYVEAYARHYRVPASLVRAMIDRESGWHPCAVSAKGAIGLMQLMPKTAEWLGVRDRCNINQNVSGGVRYLAWLMRQYHDYRLVAAAYFAGEGIVGKRGLAYRNPAVVAYVSGIRESYLRRTAAAAHPTKRNTKRDIP
jgi:soluble lytic murein transglycosylase-like protein